MPATDGTTGGAVTALASGVCRRAPARAVVRLGRVTRDLTLVRDIFQPHQNQLHAVAFFVEAPGVDQQLFTSNPRKLSLEPEVLHDILPRQNFLQQFAQARNLPGTVSCL